MKKLCLCSYPCKTENCPKESPDQMCWINHCVAIQRYSNLTYGKNFCSECGRDLRKGVKHD